MLGCEVKILSINKIGVSNFGYKPKSANKNDVSFQGGNFSSAPKRVVEKLVKKSAKPPVVVTESKSKLALLLLNNMDCGASWKPYDQIMGEIGEINKVTNDGNKVALKKMQDKHRAQNTGEASSLSKLSDEPLKNVDEMLADLKIERDDYKAQAQGIEEKLNELQEQKAKLLEQSRQAQKIIHKREKIGQFLNPETFNQKELSLVEREVALSPEKQKELADAQKELKDRKSLNNIFRKNKKVNHKSFSENREVIKNLKQKIGTLENSKTLTPEALRKKEILLAQRQAVVDFNNKTVAELEKDARPWTQAMLKAMTPEGGIVSKEVTGSDLLKLKLEALKAEEAKTSSVDAQIRAINLNILEFDKEHKAFITNMEQLERRIEVLGFEKDKAARGIVDTIEASVVLPHKQKNPSNISKIFSHKSPGEKRQASLERKEKIKERKAQYRQEVEQKTNVINDEINELKEDLRSYNNEITSMSREMERAQVQREKLVKKSPYTKAEEVREVSLNTLKRLMNETEKGISPAQEAALYKKVTTIPALINFDSVKAFKNAMKKIFKAKHKLEGTKQKEIKGSFSDIANVRIQRQIITELNVQYPNIKTITQKIDQAEKYLSPESFNQKELSFVENEILPEQKQELLAKQTLLLELKAANEVLKPFVGYVKQEKGKTTFVKFDYDAKLAAWIKKEPKEHEYTSTKFFEKGLKSWQITKAEIKAKKDKAETFFRNEEEIKKCEQRISELESQKTLTPQAAKQKEILLAQKQAVIDFNDTKLNDIKNNSLKNAIINDLPSEYRPFVNPEVMTGRNLLNLRLGVLEAEKEALIESEKETWYWSTSISHLTSERDILKTRAEITKHDIKELENQRLSLQKESKSKQKQIGREHV